MAHPSEVTGKRRQQADIAATSRRDHQRWRRGGVASYGQWLWAKQERRGQIRKVLDAETWMEWPSGKLMAPPFTAGVLGQKGGHLADRIRAQSHGAIHGTPARGHGGNLRAVD